MQRDNKQKKPIADYPHQAFSTFFSSVTLAKRRDGTLNFDPGLLRLVWFP